VDKQLAQLENAIYEAKAESGDNRRIVKELEKAKKRLTAKLKDRADRENKDNTLTFEELGVDQIFVDESDLYKNLGFVSKMNRIAGLPNAESNRALDMYIKTGYLRERNGGRGVVFATGSPEGSIPRSTKKGPAMGSAMSSGVTKRRLSQLVPSRAIPYGKKTHLGCKEGKFTRPKAHAASRS
jgi:N12 class adenine-specific DNA methylase